MKADETGGFIRNHLYFNTLQNHEGMKAVYDFINSVIVIVIVNVIVDNNTFFSSSV